MNIFEINKELQDIYNELEENEGIITDELNDKLELTQETFKSKVKDYVNLIKQIKYDIDNIDKEVDRLKQLKQSKSNIIDRLENILKYSVTLFGDTTPKGGKYYDYGTGKINIKNTNKVETNDELISQCVDKFISNINYLKYCNTLDQYNAINLKDVLAAGSDDNVSVTLTSDDIDNIDVNISITTPLKYLSEGTGLDFIKSLTQDVETYKVTGSVNKNNIKEQYKKDSNTKLNIAELKTNQTITFK